jgi:hypothetical protein
VTLPPVDGPGTAAASTLPYASVPLDRSAQDVYLVLDDFGSDGRAWSEADVEHTDLERL